MPRTANVPLKRGGGDPHSTAFQVDSRVPVDGGRIFRPISVWENDEHGVEELLCVPKAVPRGTSDAIALHRSGKTAQAVA